MVRSLWATLFLLLHTSVLEAQPSPEAVITSRRHARQLQLPRSREGFHFLIFGDRTGGPAEGVNILRQAVVEANMLDPDLVMTVGDLVEGYNTLEPWLKQMEEFRSIMDGLKMAWFPVAGNHDIYWRGPDAPAGHHEVNYEKHFGPLWYCFVHKKTGFLVLYTDEGDREKNEKGTSKPVLNQMSQEQLNWLSSSLRELKSCRQVFVFLHHPRWVDKWYPGSEWQKVHQRLTQAGNVKAVFAGHVHRLRYDGRQDGIEYYCLAATGANLPGIYHDIGYLHHMNLVTVRRSSFQVATIPIGAVIDPRQYTALRQDDVDLLRKLTLRRTSPAVKLSPDGQAGGRYSVAITNPASRAVEVTLVPEASSEQWIWSPDHRHKTVAAGDEAVFEFLYIRRPGPYDKNGETLELVLSVDYLEEKARIKIPTQRIEIDVQQ